MFINEKRNDHVMNTFNKSLLYSVSLGVILLTIGHFVTFLNGFILLAGDCLCYCIRYFTYTYNYYWLALMSNLLGDIYKC